MGKQNRLNCPQAKIKDMWTKLGILNSISQVGNQVKALSASPLQLMEVPPEQVARRYQL
jgi:hypothetical protein